MKPLFRILLLSSFPLLCACGGGEGPDGEKKPVARVNDEFLYQEDLQEILPSRYTPEDSADLAQRYINAWVRKQLFLNKATQSVKNSEQIEKKVDEFRYELFALEYEKQYLEANLDTTISEAQYLEHYNKYKDNFQLKQNIVKGFLAKIPAEAPNIGKAKQWLSSSVKLDRESLMSYCYTNATNFAVYDSLWVAFDDLVADSPFREISNQANFIQKNRFADSQDEEYVYLILITDYVISDQLSPLDFVKPKIHDMILNERIMSLKKKLKDDVFQNAQKGNDYEIY